MSRHGQGTGTPPNGDDSSTKQQAAETARAGKDAAGAVVSTAGDHVSLSGSCNKTYGSFATIIVFLVWLWISNIALLLGAEFNAEAQHERAIRAGLPADIPQFAELRDTRKLDDAELAKADDSARARDRVHGL